MSQPLSTLPEDDALSALELMWACFLSNYTPGPQGDTVRCGCNADMRPCRTALVTCDSCQQENSGKMQYCKACNSLAFCNSCVAQKSNHLGALLDQNSWVEDDPRLQFALQHLDQLQEGEIAALLAWRYVTSNQGLSRRSANPVGRLEIMLLSTLWPDVMRSPAEMVPSPSFPDQATPPGYFHQYPFAGTCAPASSNDTSKAEFLCQIMISLMSSSAQGSIPEDMRKFIESTTLEVSAAQCSGPWTKRNAFSALIRCVESRRCATSRLSFRWGCLGSELYLPVTPEWLAAALSEALTSESMAMLLDAIWPYHNGEKMRLCRLVKVDGKVSADCSVDSNSLVLLEGAFAPFELGESPYPILIPHCFVNACRLDRLSCIQLCDEAGTPTSRLHFLGPQLNRANIHVYRWRAWRLMQNSILLASGGAVMKPQNEGGPRAIAVLCDLVREEARYRFAEGEMMMRFDDLPRAIIGLLFEPTIDDETRRKMVPLLVRFLARSRGRRLVYKLRPEVPLLVKPSLTQFRGHREFVEQMQNFGELQREGAPLVFRFVGRTSGAFVGNEYTDAPRNVTAQREVKTLFQLHMHIALGAAPGHPFDEANRIFVSVSRPMAENGNDMSPLPPGCSHAFVSGLSGPGEALLQAASAATKFALPAEGHFRDRPTQSGINDPSTLLVVRCRPFPSRMFRASTWYLLVSQGAALEVNTWSAT